MCIASSFQNDPWFLQFPVRELWYRGSLAWQQVLAGAPESASKILVVAHNAINQGALAVAGQGICLAFGRPRVARRAVASSPGWMRWIRVLPLLQILAAWRRAPPPRSPPAAMICTAIGLPPSYFRRMVQTNAAATVVDLVPPKPGMQARQRVVIDRVNQSTARQVGWKIEGKKRAVQWPGTRLAGSGRWQPLPCCPPWLAGA